VAALALLGLAGCGSFFSQTHGCTTCTVPTFLFASQSNAVTGFTLSSSGVPSLVGSQTGPNTTEGMVVDKSASFLFVSDFQNGTVDAFTINSTSGSLSAVAGSPFSAGPAPGAGGLALDPSTRFLYVTQTNSAAVAAFTIAAGTGVLTPIAGSPFPTQSNLPGPNRMAIGGGGEFLYIGMSGTVNANHTISAFSIDSTTGALTQIPGSPFTSGNDPQGLATDPGGKLLYTANSKDNTLSAFTIDGSSGALTPISGSPFATQAAPAALAIDPAGQFLNVGESSTKGIEALRVDAATGAVTPISGSPFLSGSTVNALAAGKP
jgi:6-phosphogluconolactonase (cycloisomerase 2 family)